MPFLSIIVPVFNVEKYLEECLDSILNQTNQDFELILVNDGSTDDSGSICKSYKERYPEKIKLIHQNNSGLLITRRVGFQAASGEYVLCVDSDDYQMPGIIQEIYKAIKEFNCDMVIFDYIYGSGQNKPERVIHVCPEKTTTYFCGDEILRFRMQLIAGKDFNSLCCKAVRRSCVDIDTDYSEWNYVANGEDSFQSLPILDVVQSICYIPYTGYFYRRDNMSLSKYYRVKDFGSFMCVYKRTLMYANRWGASSDVIRQVNCRYASLLSVVIHQARREISKKDYHAFLKAISKNDAFNELCKSVNVDNWYQKIIFALLSHRRIELLPGFMNFANFISLLKNSRKISGIINMEDLKMPQLTEKNTLIFIINGMFGGGAERVMTLLVNKSVQKGYGTFFVLTNQKVQDAKKYDIDLRVHFISLDNVEIGDFIKQSRIDRIREAIATGVFRGTKKLGMKIPNFAIYSRFIFNHGERVNKLRSMFFRMPNATIVAFLDYSIHLALLAAAGLSNQLIISERGDPKMHDESINASYFIRKHYQRANRIVFQTKGAKSYYANELQSKGTIIPNPIMDNLPNAIQGGFVSRQKIAVNFCRISREKNLKLLIDVFAEFWLLHQDFKLQIIGNTEGSDSQLLLRELNLLIRSHNMDKVISILPFSPDIHKEIINYSMFVSSSDYEGMSNSMLEAMAIGLPTICTDCPAGGAREIIENGENGILVPIDDKDSLLKAMCRVADDEELSNRLSINGSQIRIRLSENSIYEKWEQLFIHKS